VAARRCPCRLFAVPAGAVSDLSCQVDYELRPLHQILAPNVMILILKRFRNVWKPRQWAWVGRCGLWEAPVEHGGHVAGGVEFSSGGGCLQVDERVLTGLSRQSEQVCSESRPRRLAGELGDDLVGSAVEHLNDLRSDELFGRHLEPVGVALDGVEQPRGWVTELTQQCGGGDGRVVVGENLSEELGRGAGGDGVGTDHSVRVAVADDLQVKMVGRSSAGEHGVQLLP
jgi:hypothetical protein